MRTSLGHKLGYYSSFSYWSLCSSQSKVTLIETRHVVTDIMDNLRNILQMELLRMNAW
jgi:hypothetical protein